MIGTVDLVDLLGIDPDEFERLLEVATDDELAFLYEALEELAGDSGEWALQERQQVAEGFALSGDVFEVLYGGAAGGGKSEWLLYHFYHLAKNYPGFSGLIIRRTFPELRRSLILRSWGLFDRSIARYNVSEHTWYFHNGSVLEFGYCETDRDVFQYMSAEYDAVGFDELTQFETDFCWTYLSSRCRTTVRKSIAGMPAPHMVAGTNPGGVGGMWVKERFVDPAPAGEVQYATIDLDGGESRTVGRVFIPAKLGDNRYVNKTQYRIALANLSDTLRAQLEDGSWDVVEGQFFDEWDRDVHVVEPFAIPEWWERICGYDFGFAAPACHLWAAIGLDGQIVVYREMYGNRLTVREQADRILLAERADPAHQKQAERIQTRVADPSIWTRTGAGPPIADQFADEGVIFRKANNARIDGWMRVRSFLRVNEATAQPHLIIFKTCTNLIRTLPMLVHDDRRPEDVNTKQEDHAADALRYMLMTRPAPTTAPREHQPRPGLNADGERIVDVASRIKQKKRAMSSPIGTIRR